MTRPEPEFHVSSSAYGESITVECALCEAIEEWVEYPLSFTKVNQWVADHRGKHFGAWEQEQRDAGNVYFAHYFRYNSEYRDEFFDPLEAARFLDYGEEEGNLSARGVVYPDGSERDLDEVLGKDRLRTGKGSA